MVWIEHHFPCKLNSESTWNAEFMKFEAQVEAEHWWFAGRRQLFANEIARANIRQSSSVLDVGVGSGSNLRMLAEMKFPNVIGLDPNSDVVRLCRKRGLLVSNWAASATCHFRRKALILFSQPMSLSMCKTMWWHTGRNCRVLRPGGCVLITCRRSKAYGACRMKSHCIVAAIASGRSVERVVGAKLTVVRSYYFNYLLFAPIWAARQVVRLSQVRLQSENEINRR